MSFPGEILLLEHWIKVRSIRSIKQILVASVSFQSLQVSLERGPHGGLEEVKFHETPSERTREWLRFHTNFQNLVMISIGIVFKNSVN